MLLNVIYTPNNELEGEHHEVLLQFTAPEIVQQPGQLVEVAVQTKLLLLCHILLPC